MASRFSRATNDRLTLQAQAKQQWALAQSNISSARKAQISNPRTGGKPTSASVAGRSDGRDHAAHNIDNGSLVMSGSNLHVHADAS